MRGLTSGRPPEALAYLAVVAIGLQLVLGISAPGFAAWSPSHAHLTLDGRDHAHTHPWDALSGAAGRIPGHEADDHSQSEATPSSNLTPVGAAVALPGAVILLAVAGLTLLARLSGSPVLRGASFVPATPPPRG